jgi:signal transduction histidine kinase
VDGAIPVANPIAPRVAKTLARALIAALGYYAFGYIGTVLSVPPSGFAIIWPTAAFLVGLLLLTPVRDWWTIAPAVVIAHLALAGLRDPAPPEVVLLVQAGGNIVRAVLTALAVMRISGGRPKFDTFRDTLAFILVAVAVPAVVDTVTLGLHLLIGWTQDFGLSWRQWMMASVFPAITLTPLIVIGGTRAARARARRSAAEMAVLCGLLFGLTLLAFGRAPEPELRPTLLLMPLPLLVFAAARWGVGGASLALLVFAGAIVADALSGLGPFAAGSSMGAVRAVQVYLTAIAAPTVLMAALMDERRKAEERLKRSEARMEIVAASTDTGLWQWDAASAELWMTEHCREMFRLSSDARHTPESFLAAVHPDDRPRVRTALHDALSAADRALRAFRVMDVDRGERWFILHTHAQLDRRDRLVCVSGVFRDITSQLASQRQSEQLTRRLQTLQEDERKQIAEALHDSTAQHVVGIGLLMGMLERRMSLTDETRPLIDDMRNLVGEATRELRTFTYLLRPPDLERQALGVALNNYVTGFALRTGLAAATRFSGAADDLAVEHRASLLRIAQESLANVHRHAAASRVSVELRRYHGALHLLIADNGRGIAAASAATYEGAIHTGVGIPGMRARMRELGGRLEIRSTSRGTLVHAALPMRGALERRRPRAAARHLHA